MKNPQQIIAELEKGCGKDTNFYWGEGKFPSEFYTCGKRHPVIDEVFYCKECKAALSSAQNMSKAKDVWFEKLIDEANKVDLGELDRFEKADVDFINYTIQKVQEYIKSKLKGVEEK